MLHEMYFSRIRMKNYDVITDGKNGIKMNAVSIYYVTNYCFYRCSAVTVTDNKMLPVTIIRIITSYIDSGSQTPADKIFQNPERASKQERARKTECVKTDGFFYLFIFYLNFMTLLCRSFQIKN